MSPDPGFSHGGAIVRSKRFELMCRCYVIFEYQNSTYSEIQGWHHRQAAVVLKQTHREAPPPQAQPNFFIKAPGHVWEPCGRTSGAFIGIKWGSGVQGLRGLGV